MQYIDCLINPLTRTVQYPGNTTIVQRDTNVEVLRFHYSLDAQHELENDSIRIMVASGKEVRGFQAENVRTELNDGGDDELVFEHTITSYETSKAGQITVSVCGNKVTGNTITEAWHTLNMAFQVANAIHTESDEGEDTPETAASNAEKIAALQTLVDAITSGRPIPVDLKSKMTDTSAIYLYTGNETGEQHNYWYYHDGTTWVPGSEYGGVTVDDELSATSENPVQNKVIKGLYDEVNGRLGDLSELETETKTDLVSAINEAAKSSNVTFGTEDASEDIITALGVYDGDINTSVNPSRLRNTVRDTIKIAYYPVTPGKTYIVSKGVTSKSFIVGFTAFTPSNNVNVYEVVDKGNGFTGNVSVTAPDYVKYLCVQYFYNDDTNPENIFASVLVAPSTEISLKTKIGRMDDSIAENKIVYNISNVDPDNDGVVVNVAPSAGGTYYYGGKGSSYIIPLSPNAVIVEVRGNSLRNSYLMFLQNARSFSVNAKIPSCAGGRIYEIPNGDQQSLKIPDGAKYMLVQKAYATGGYTCTPEYIKIVSVLDREPNTQSCPEESFLNSIGFLSDSEGMDVPMFSGVLNAYKRAHQFYDIEWTALAAIPTDSSATGCSAGRHKGMLYSEALQYEKYVGFGASIKAFMTALHNPYSVMYTEDTKGTNARKKSAYGFDYLNTSLNGAFYGTVCSAFASFVLGSPYVWQTFDLDWMSRRGLFVEVFDNSAQGARLMDVYWKSGHVRVVTDIKRDSRGRVTHVTLTESGHDYVGQSVRTASAFDDMIRSERAKLYRYRDLYKNTNYEASEFVAVEDETISDYSYNDDICTYLGDCVSIADWESMYINYSKGSYTGMELYKGTTLIDTIALPDAYNDTHSIDITNYLTGAGEYKARLTDGTNYSDYTYFEVVDTNVTTSYSNDGILTVTYASTNAEPIYIKFKNLDGYQLAMYNLTETDRMMGKCLIDYQSLRTEQGRENVNKALYARVFFAGKYNQVMGDYVDTEIV